MTLAHTMPKHTRSLVFVLAIGRILDFSGYFHNHLCVFHPNLKGNMLQSTDDSPFLITLNLNTTTTSPKKQQANKQN